MAAKKRSKKKSWWSLIKILMSFLFNGVKFLCVCTYKTTKYLINAAYNVIKKSADKKHKKETGQKEIKIPSFFTRFKIEEKVTGSLAQFEKRLDNDSLIISICGRRGSGKSALGFRILENIHARVKRPVFVLGVNQNLLPHWIRSVNSLNEVKDNGTVLVDEGAVAFAARSSMSKKNKDLSSLLAIARHRDLTLVLITQNTGMIDKNVLALTDTLILKQGSLLQSQMERNFMKKMYKKADKYFSKLKDKRKYFYVIDSDFEGMLEATLPTFWSTGVSKNQGRKE